LCAASVCPRLPCACPFYLLLGMTEPKTPPVADSTPGAPSVGGQQRGGGTPAVDRPEDAAAATSKARHFVQQIIDEHIERGKWGAPGDGAVIATRFPPEPNGYLHVGHAKAITLNASLAREFGGRFYLRFDDTNPAKEEQEFVDSITRDIRWLVGPDWPGSAAGDGSDLTRFASDYFGFMFDCACDLIEKGLAYVDEQSAEDVRRQRGTLTEPGRKSPHRDRPAAESLELFGRMKDGEFEPGTKVLRAKIDMGSPNLNLRDPVMYRIVHARHHRTDRTWCVYPMYDWAHGLEDSVEKITHSLCTLEFEIHRPLYDWFIEAVNKGRTRSERIHHSKQIEFARLSLNYTVTSKRKLLELVKEKKVSGWDDPRMPTIAGMRRRGYTRESISRFCEEVGVTKYDSTIDVGRLENAVRHHLNAVAPRRMAVLNPLKVTITNWGDGDRVEWLEAVNNPERPEDGTRPIPFSKTLYIEHEDFMEDAPKKFFRLKPGGEVRLRYGYWIACHDVVKDDRGEVVELLCTYDPATRGGDSPPPDADGNVRKVKGTLHWVSAEHAQRCEVRLFDRLFDDPQPDKQPKGAPEGWSFMDNLNADSLSTVQAAIEPNWRPEGPLSARWADGIERVQFERHGYFCLDSESTDASPVWNRTVSLKDSWAKASR